MNSMDTYQTGLQNKVMFRWKSLEQNVLSDKNIQFKPTTSCLSIKRPQRQGNYAQSI